MITNLQIRAARSLLEWKQEDLAQAADVSPGTLAALEQGKGSARPATYRAIQTALEESGIEFLDDCGVRLRRDRFHLQLLEGHESILKVWRDIESCFYKQGGEVLLSGVDERIWIRKYRDDLADTLKIRQGMHIKTRLLISEGDTLLTAPVASYRAIPKYLFQQTPYYVYADRLAIINWGPPQNVLLVQNPMIAETFRKQFEFNWQIGKELDPSKVAVWDSK